jgi:hypothetical protein
MASLGKSARYYRRNKTAREKKKRYDTKYHKTPSRKKYRAELNTARRRRKLKGNPKDLHHSKNGKLVLRSRKANRGDKSKK